MTQDSISGAVAPSTQTATQAQEPSGAPAAYPDGGETTAAPTSLVGDMTRTEAAVTTIGGLGTGPATRSYWDYQPTAEQIEAVEPTSVHAATGTAQSALAVTDPVPIDGNATNSAERQTRTTPDGKDVLVDPLHEGTEVAIARERTIAEAGFGQTYVSSDQVVLDAGEGDNAIQVTRQDDGTLRVDVNGEQYDVRLASGQELTLRGGAGNDGIEVAPEVTANVVIEAGDGDNTIATGSGDDRVHVGSGNDTVVSAGGHNYVMARGGDNALELGDGNNVIYGGDGRDEVLLGDGRNFVHAGGGDDTIHGGDGGNMTIGGDGDDTITVGSGNDRVYTGTGTDRVEIAGGDDNVVYAVGDDDQITAADGATHREVEVASDGEPGSQGIRVVGSEAFQQRIAADLDLLRTSPVGRQMLAELDAAAERDGNVVTIGELANEQNGYAISSGGQIVDGQPSPGSDVEVRYNPEFFMAEAFPAPVVVLFHELSHAYNGVNGTFQPGTYFGSDQVDSGRVPNAERQAVGLESSAPAYDFDGDPATPPTTHNPFPLTENGIREELGLPPRPHYTIVQ